MNELTAKAMQTIFDDEHDHYMEQAKEALSHIKSEEDLQRMKDAIQKISEQRVWMRGRNVPERHEQGRNREFYPKRTGAKKALKSTFQQQPISTIIPGRGKLPSSNVAGVA